MANYNLYSGDELVNTIVADEEFVVSYAEEMGYTYELVPEEPRPEPAPPEEDVTWSSMATSIKEGVDDV